MNQVNYQKKLDQLIEMNRSQKKVPTLFLHSCCAPCSSYVLEYLSSYFFVTVFFYNPNISPREEYEKRVGEIQRLIREQSYLYPVKFLEGVYEPERFFSMAKGMEMLPEGGQRCFACYRLRMEEAARLAAEGGYDYFRCYALRLEEAAREAKKGGYDFFTTTLSISPLKNAQKLNEIGEELARVYKVSHLPSDFKKKNGYRRSVELSHEYGLYRQNYCGCVFSKREAVKREQAKKIQE